MQQKITGAFGGIEIDANAAQAHLQHHAEDFAFEPIGGAGAFLIENRIEILVQQKCVNGVGFGVDAGIARRQLPDVSLRDELLALVAVQSERLDSLPQQRIVFSRHSAPGAQGIEAIFEAVFVDQSAERADFLQAFAGWHFDAGFRAQPTNVIEPILGNEARAGSDVVA